MVMQMNATTRRAPMSATTESQSGSMAPTLFGVTAALLACAMLVIVGLVGRPAGGLDVPKGSRVIHVDEFDYGLRMPAGALPSGNLVVVDTNRGSVPHELVMFKTAGPGAKLPLRKDGS